MEFHSNFWNKFLHFCNPTECTPHHRQSSDAPASKTQKQHIFSAFYSILKDFLVM